MQELRASNELLGKPHELRAAIEQEGYVFLRDVLDHDLLDHVKHGVMAWFEAQGIVRVEGGEPMFTGRDAGYLGDYPAGLYATMLWEWYALRPELKAFYEQVYGEKGYVIPNGEYQFTWPGRPGCSVRVHQDGPFNTGVDFCVFWIPLMNIDEPVGGLSIVPGPQSRGSLHPGIEKNPTSPWIPRETFADDDWYRADYRPGDVLIFGSLTPHCGLPNTSDRLRLSIDIRVQPASAKRPISGVVVAAEEDSMTIAADRGDEIKLLIDENTALRLPTYVAGRLDRTQFLGQRVFATEEQGRALLIRNPWGHVPWDQ